MLTRFIKFITNLVVFSIVIVAVFGYFSHTIKASNEQIIWQTDFDQESDLSDWNVKNESNETILSNGLLTLKQIDNFKMVFLETVANRNDNQNLMIEVKFRYIGNRYDYGAGIGVNDRIVPDRMTASISLYDRTIAVWTQVNNSFAVVSSICLEGATCADNDHTNSKPILIGEPGFTSWHILKIKYENKKYEVSLDDNYLFETQTTDRKPNYIWIGDPQITATPVDFSLLDVDYVKVTNLDNGEVDFPYLSQKDPRWGAEEYDHASQWAAADHQGIANWGCALTSAAMIFQHFGVKSLTGQEITPPILNNWLNNQPDGYIGNGLVNWIALTRYAKESREAGQSPTSLEFTTTAYNPQTTYETPSILNLPGHFVVGYDQTDSQFKIKDPADATKETIDKTSARIKRIDRFIPSNTDLSYFLFTINPEFEIKLKDENGNEIGQVFEQEPLVDDMTPDATISGNQNLKVLMVAKPPQGDFELWVTNPNTNDQNYSLKEFFYDHEGQVEVKEEQEHLLGQHSDVYHFSYGGNVGETSTPISIDSILQILDSYHDSLKVKEFYYRYVHNWLSTAQQETNSQRQKEIMTGLRQVVENNSMVIETPARLDIQNRINQWLENH